MIAPSGTDVRDGRAEIIVTDKIALTIPADRAFRGVATLVLGGIGSRLNLPYERMDDLQLAVLSILEAASADDVSMEIVAEDHRVTVAVGPLVQGSAHANGLARVLSKLVDSMESGVLDGDGGEWLSITLERTLPEIR